MVERGLSSALALIDSEAGVSLAVAPTVLDAIANGSTSTTAPLAL